MTDEPVYCCHVCGAFLESYTIEIEINGMCIKSPHHFVYLYRGCGKPIGLCNVCFDGRRFDGFAPHEVAYFYEEFTKPD